MKITLLTVQAPFIRGGAEMLIDHFQTKLRDKGHQVAIVAVPFKWYPAESILDHMLACRTLGAWAGNPDLVLGMKFPAYLAPTPARRRKMWLIHQFRQAHELYGTRFGCVPTDLAGRRIRDMIRVADKKYLGEYSEIFTVSNRIGDRLRRSTGVEPTETLYSPPLNDECFHAGDFGDYFFYPSRQNEGKRQHLAIEAMRYVRGDFKLVLAGKPDAAEYGERLNGLIRSHRLQDRVVSAGWIDETKKAELAAESCGMLYLPFDEDTHGYVTMEAFLSHKPVICCVDSGGTDELVFDGRNGLVVEPTPEAIADAMDRLYADKTAARRLGAEGRKTLAEKNINWDYIIDRIAA